MLIAAEALGIGRVALEKAVGYANERVVFGRPIGMNQAIQFLLADSLARLDAAELILRKATWLYDNGRPADARRTPPNTCARTPDSPPPTGRCRPMEVWATPRNTTWPAISVRPV